MSSRRNRLLNFPQKEKNKKIMFGVIVLTLLGYTGKYVDYGTLGFPEKNIKVPSGEAVVE